MKHLVVFTGAGISAESGISTFRDSNGLWENYDVHQVAHISSWSKNKSLMLDFYNQRRKQLQQVKPNDAHLVLAGLERYFKVSVITQNVDNLHEMAGSSNVIHLHGELTKACNESKTEVIDIAYNDIKLGDRAADGSQLRPFIVWFGEQVPMMKKAENIVMSADLLLVVGTSLQVYPAANLIDFTEKPIYVIDPQPLNRSDVTLIQAKASEGMKLFKAFLLEDKPLPVYIKQSNKNIKVEKMNKTCEFNCSDVIIKKYFQESIAKKDAIKLILISEAFPQNSEDYFDGKGEPQFLKNTNTVFNSLGFNYQTYSDYLNNGIYLTTAIKCIKKDYLVSSETLKNCSLNLEKELDEFVNKRAIMLMGDFAIKAMNYIWKRKFNEKIIPAGSTYKIRGGVYESNGIRFFPSYTQTGDSFGLEKSKVAMIKEDVEKAMKILV